MASQWTDVRTFGGGLNFSVHPAGLRDDEWTYCTGFRAQLGNADSMPAYVTVNDGSWIPATYTPALMVEDLVGANAGVLLPIRSGANVKLYNVQADGTATEITVSGTAPTMSATGSTSPRFIAERTVLNGTQLFPVGTSSYGIMTYDGTNFSRLTPGSGTIAGRWMVSYANRLITGNARTIYMADQSSLTDWTPAVSNSADTIDLDDPGAVRSLIPTQDGVIVIGDERIYMLRSTGGIPPFTLSLLSYMPNAQVYGAYGVTPVGVLYSRRDGLHLVGGGMWEPSLKVGRAIQDIQPRMFYDPIRGELIIRVGNAEIWRCELATGAWSTSSAPATLRDHCDSRYSSYTHYLLSSSAHIIYRDGEVADGSGYSGARVDTKDFTLPDGATAGYIDRIRVSWEPLTNATTDALQVYGWARQDYWPAASTGNAKFQYGQGSGDFTSVGTMTGGGVTELPCRFRGRYMRWSFRPTSGMVRIRGFSFRWKPASDRKGAA